MIKNKFYEAPEAELLVVKFEENFCGTLNGLGDSGKSGGILESNDYGDGDGDLF